MVKLKYCTIERNGDVTTTKFPDGTETSNWPPDDGGFVAQIARDCGFMDDVAAYIYEHDVCHAYLSQLWFDKVSPVLWRSAHGLEPGPENEWEEKLVYYYQKGQI